MALDAKDGSVQVHLNMLQGVVARLRRSRDVEVGAQVNPPLARVPRGRLKLALGCLSAAVLTGCAGGGAVGFIVGDPTGLSYEHDLGGRSALVLGLGLDFAGWEPGRGHLDWIEHTSYVRGGQWVPYWGVGVRVHIRDVAGSAEVVDAGPRVPLGLTYDFGNRRPYLFAEVAPGLDLIGRGYTIDWAFGLRFAF